MENCADLPHEPFRGTGSLVDTFNLYKIFSASLLLCISVVISYLGWLALKRLINILWYHFMRSVEITGSLSCCPIRTFFLQWLQNSVQTKRLPHVNIFADSNQDEYGQTTFEFKNHPSYQTTNYFTYKGHWVFLRRLHLRNVLSQDATCESFTLSTFVSNAWILDEIMEEVRLLFEDKPVEDGKTRFYCRSGDYWSECGDGKRKLPLSSVILNTTIATKVVDDLREFLNTPKWYQDRGIPYRRGYMLYGPPGCGKSSFIKATAGEINYNICIMSLSSKDLNDDILNNLMNSTPDKCIILLEDIDTAFPKRDDEDDSDDKMEKKKKNEESGNSSGKVTLRGLLNSLDGVASTEGRIVFLTTNYINRLDSVMTRPGRVDLKVFIDLPDDDQLLRMFVRFYPEENAETDAKEFVRKIRSLKQPRVSMAMVQGHFMMHKYDYKKMMDGIDQYFEEQFFSLKF